MDDIKTGTISITGLKDLEKRLMTLSDRIAKNVLAGATRAAAVVIQKEAIIHAPVAKDILKKKFHGQTIEVPPGFMRSRIKAWRRRKTNYAVTFSVGVAGYKDRNSKFFPFWWRFQEFETGNSKEAAHPFLRPAFESKKTEAVERFRDYAGPRIEKEAAKL